MKPTINDKLIAYLTLLSGLAISGVAEYYSIMGLIAIYPAALIPIVIMGVVLGLGKISGTVWLKQNWEWSPFFLKAYVLPAIVVLMMITSLGVFGFLSKAHSDQSLVSGDVQSKVAIYDEKIKTEKENIEANRKALKQMDEGVDQVLGRSTDEKGADKAVAMRRSQQKERARLQNEISQSQKSIAELNDARAPIAAEVRKVDAEVGPIKYIAHLMYGENPDANILEKAVIWVTVLIVIVLDPLAVVLLLASQYSFQRFREHEEDLELLHETVPVYVADVGEKPTEEEKKSINDFVPQPTEYIPEEEEYARVIEKEGVSPSGPVVDVVSPEPTDTTSVIEEVIPTIAQEMLAPITTQVEAFVEPEPIRTVITGNRVSPRTKVFKRPEEPTTFENPTAVTEEAVQQVLSETPKPNVHVIGDGEYVHVNGQTYHRNSLPSGLLDSYVQNEEQKDSNLWSSTKKD